MISSQCTKSLLHLFDSDMFFSDQINPLSKLFHFHIRDIRRIRHLFPLSTTTALANSLVSSKLDYIVIHCILAFHNQISINFSTFKFIGTCHYKHFQISAHHTNTEKLHLLPIKQIHESVNKLQCLLTYKALTIQQPVFTKVFHFRHI